MGRCIDENEKLLAAILLQQHLRQRNSRGLTELEPRSLWWLELEDFISSLDLKAVPPPPSPPPPPPPPPILPSLFGTNSLELRIEHCLDLGIESLPPGKIQMGIRNTNLEYKLCPSHLGKYI